MNHILIDIYNRSKNEVILLSTERSPKELETLIKNSVQSLVADRERRIKNNYFFLNPSEFTGEEKNRPTRKVLVLNETFKIEKKEFYLNQFYNFDENEVLHFNVLMLKVVEVDTYE